MSLTLFLELFVAKNIPVIQRYPVFTASPGAEQMKAVPLTLLPMFDIFHVAVIWVELDWQSPYNDWRTEKEKPGKKKKGWWVGGKSMTYTIKIDNSYIWIQKFVPRKRPFSVLGSRRRSFIVASNKKGQIVDAKMAHSSYAFTPTGHCYHTNIQTSHF